LEIVVGATVSLAPELLPQVLPLPPPPLPRGYSVVPNAEMPTSGSVFVFVLVPSADGHLTVAEFRGTAGGGVALSCWSYEILVFANRAEVHVGPVGDSSRRATRR